MAVRFADVTRAATAGYHPTTGPTTGLVAGFGLVALCAAAALDPTAVEHGPVLCPFRLVTGLPCPGCGLTRSWVYLAHGHWGESFTANPFGVVALLFVVVAVLPTALCVVRRRSFPTLRRLFDGRVVWVVVAAWLAFGVVRLTAVATAHVIS
jgi:uncharacterized protein DUF2752